MACFSVLSQWQIQKWFTTLPHPVRAMGIKVCVWSPSNMFNHQQMLGWPLWGWHAISTACVCAWPVQGVVEVVVTGSPADKTTQLRPPQPSHWLFSNPHPNPKLSLNNKINTNTHTHTGTHKLCADYSAPWVNLRFYTDEYIQSFLPLICCRWKMDCRMEKMTTCFL